MNTVSAVKKQNLIKINHKKKKIQRNRKIIAIGILLLTLFIIGTSIKNMYVSYRCSNFLYSVDYYFTHWKDKSLRLIEVESISILAWRISWIDSLVGYGPWGLKQSGTTEAT